MTRRLGGHQAVWRGQEMAFSLPTFRFHCLRSEAVLRRCDRRHFRRPQLHLCAEKMERAKRRRVRPLLLQRNHWGSRVPLHPSRRCSIGRGCLVALPVAPARCVEARPDLCGRAEERWVPVGVAVVIVRRRPASSQVAKAQPRAEILDYQRPRRGRSRCSTRRPTWNSVYLAGLVFKWMMQEGGLSPSSPERNAAQGGAAVRRDRRFGAGFYRNAVAKRTRARG